VAGLVAGLGGAVLFAWSMQHAGSTAVVDGFRRVGSGFIIVILLGGVRALVRTAGWRMCLDSEDQRAFRSMLAAYLAGDAIGNVTPFGFLASEPSKIVMVRRRIALPASVASLTVENLFYSATVLVMLVTGTAGLLLSFELPPSLRIASLVVLLVAPLVAVAAGWVVMTDRRVVRASLEWLVRRPAAARYLSEWLPHIRQTGDRIVGFVARHPGKVIPLIVLEATYHVAAIAEVWFVLSLIAGVQTPVLTAFVLEAVNRTITIAFQFVPMWVGVDEASTAAVTSAVNLGSAAGISLALVRKTRIVVWTAIGFLLVVEFLWVGMRDERHCDRRERARRRHGEDGEPDPVPDVPCVMS
jgi:lysylphosphatidylglycerol synthase-like protein